MVYQVMTKHKLSVVTDQVKHPLKFWNFIRLKLAYLLKSKVVPVLPVILDVEPNNNCNFKCQHCQVTHWHKPVVHLDEKSFAKILNQFPHLARVKLQGMGEPLLNQHFIPMLKMGEARGISMLFHSNGSICHAKNAEKLVELKNTTISFSFDGATAKTFEAIRPGSKFEQIKKNIKYFSQIRGSKKQPLLSIWTVITRDNIYELPQIVKLAKELGVDYITLQPHLTNWGKEEMKEYINHVKIHPDSEDTAVALTVAKQIAKQNSIDLNINQGDLYSKSKKCPWAWNSAHISANGDVSPCCIVSDANIAKMGNVFEQNFAEIWNSPAYQDFRERIRTHNLPNHCKNCYVDPD